MIFLSTSMLGCSIYLLKRIFVVIFNQPLSSLFLPSFLWSFSIKYPVLAAAPDKSLSILINYYTFIFFVYLLTIHERLSLIKYFTECFLGIFYINLLYPIIFYLFSCCDWFYCFHQSPSILFNNLYYLFFT